MDRGEREGEDVYREVVRKNLGFWIGGSNHTPEDLLCLAWDGEQPWVVKLEGEALQAIVKLAALEERRYEDVDAVFHSISFGARLTLRRLHMEGTWHQALQMIEHPEIYGPVGDVLELGWPREVELYLWIEASEYSWSAYEGVKRLLKSLYSPGEPVMPAVLLEWAIEVALGERRQPSKGHRPVSETHRDQAIVLTIFDLTEPSSRRRRGSKRLTRQMACQLIGEELNLEPDTIQKIWQKGKSINNPQFIAPSARPFPLYPPPSKLPFWDHSPTFSP